MRTLSLPAILVAIAVVACHGATESTEGGASDLAVGASRDGGADDASAVVTSGGDASAAYGPDAAEGAPCSVQAVIDTRACQRGLSCTYDLGADHGTCIRPGTAGGLCGATYSDFSGGECESGLTCIVGTAAFASMPGEPATDHGYLVGRCRGPGGAGAACSIAFDATEDLHCARGFACTYDEGAKTGTCIAPGTEGGLCGSTYADFAGGECGPGLTCPYGTAAYPSSDDAATYHPDTVGRCAR